MKNNSTYMVVMIEDTATGIETIEAEEEVRIGINKNHTSPRIVIQSINKNHLDKEALRRELLHHLDTLPSKGHHRHLKISSLLPMMRWPRRSWVISTTTLTRTSFLRR